MSAAFSVNDHIKYGSTGVCLIEEIKNMAFPGSKEQRPYYILRPLNSPASTVFVPLDNQKLVGRMRSVLTKEEIDAILLSAKSMEIEWVKDRKLRDEAFRTILVHGDEKELILLVGCMYRQNRELKLRKKSLSSSDEAILKAAEKNICEEFAFALKLNETQVGEYIRERLDIPDETDFSF